MPPMLATPLPSVGLAFALFSVSVCFFIKNPRTGSPNIFSLKFFAPGKNPNENVLAVDHSFYFFGNPVGFRPFASGEEHS
jgi:hypothetical protein